MGTEKGESMEGGSNLGAMNWNELASLYTLMSLNICEDSLSPSTRSEIPFLSPLPKTNL